MLGVAEAWVGVQRGAGFAANALFGAKTEWKVVQWNFASGVQPSRVFGLSNVTNRQKKAFLNQKFENCTASIKSVFGFWLGVHG